MVYSYSEETLSELKVKLFTASNVDEKRVALAE